jgi:DNA-binding MarR family transcriptional regulator
MKFWEEELTKYLEKTLNVKVRGLSTSTSARKTLLSHIPLYMRAACHIQLYRIDEYNFTLLHFRPGHSLSPKQLISAFKLLVLNLEFVPILVFDEISAQERAAFLRVNVPFVVPHAHVYIPQLALHLSDKFLRKGNRLSLLTPSTQCIFLLALLHDLRLTDFPEIMTLTGYTKMTVSRAINELKKLGLCEKSEGYKAQIRFSENKRELWEAGLPYLQSPIIEEVYVHECAFNKKFKHTGYTALAEYSDISKGNLKSFAIHRKDYKSDPKFTYPGLAFPEEGGVQIQLWTYDPHIVDKSNTVDPLSLFLTMRSDNDDRTQMALEQMISSVL